MYGNLNLVIYTCCHVVLVFETIHRACDETTETVPHEQPAQPTLDEEDFNRVLDDESSDSDKAWLPELHLLKSDKAAIESDTNWLNDRIIYAWLMLLKEKFHALNGFSDPVFVEALRVSYKDLVFSQILFNGDNHWVTVTNKNCPPNTVRMYDSLSMLPSVSIKQQIAALCRTDASEINIQSMSVARQKGGSDCAMFAMAYITSICMGQDPVNVVYEQQSMRKHLLHCIVAKDITSFPVQSNRTIRKPVSFNVAIKLHCLCRLTHTRGAKMIECTRCKEWFHQSCLMLSSSAFDEAAANKSFLCPKCFPL